MVFLHPYILTSSHIRIDVQPKDGSTFVTIKGEKQRFPKLNELSNYLRSGR